ncbi:MAG: carbonic anhydrase [Ostreibacterium sp.]
MATAVEALNRLKIGNKRFVEGHLKHRILDECNRVKMSAVQNPCAIILGCSDARVPAEMIFDQGIGDLFVIRVAGNIIAPSQVGSVEYAVKQFGTPLVVVLGHTDCGAVTACIDDIQQGTNAYMPNLYSIVERIRPAIHTLVETSLGDDRPELIKHAVRANVRASVANLRYSSVTLEKYIGQGQVVIVGAEYNLATGEVDFFEGLPDNKSMVVSLAE